MQQGCSAAPVSDDKHRWTMQLGLFELVPVEQLLHPGHQRIEWRGKGNTNQESQATRIDSKVAIAQ